jgi:hypothetical protein
MKMFVKVIQNIINLAESEMKFEDIQPDLNVNYLIFRYQFLPVL